MFAVKRTQAFDGWLKGVNDSKVCTKTPGGRMSTAIARITDKPRLLSLKARQNSAIEEILANG
jgi:hypothetical protein